MSALSSLPPGFEIAPQAAVPQSESPATLPPGFQIAKQPSNRFGIDFSQPIEDVRAQIASLTGKDREDALRAWAEDYVRRERSDGGIGQTVGDTVRNLARGTLVAGPWLDEATAKTAGVLHDVTRGYLGAPEDEALAYQRATDRAIDAENPALSVGTQIAGGVASAVATPIARLFAPAQTTLGTGARLAGTGAAVGGYSGFGHGEGSVSQRADNALTGAAIGAVAAPAIGAVSGAVGLGVRAGRDAVARARPEPVINDALARSGSSADALAEQYVGQVVRRGAGGMDSPAAQQALHVYHQALRNGQNQRAARAAAVAHVAQQTGRTPQTASRYVGDILRNVERSQDSPLMLGEAAARAADDAGINNAATAELMEGIATRRGTRGSRTIFDAVQRRQSEQRGRVQTVFGRAMGVDDVDAAIATAEQDLRDLGDVMYRQAYAAEQPFQRDLWNVVMRFQRISGNRGGRPGEELQRAIDTFRVRLGENIYGIRGGLRVFVGNRASVRDQLDRLRRGTAEHRLVRGFYDAITRVVGRRNPEWLAANNAFGEQFGRARTAVELGEMLFSRKGVPGRALLERIRGLPPDQLEGARAGYVRAVWQRLDEAGDGHDMGKFFRNEHQRRILRALFGDDGAADIVRRLRDEQITTQSTRRLAGSQTAPRQQILQDMSLDPQVAGSMSLLNPMSLLDNIGQRVSTRIQDVRDRRIAEILTTLQSDPQAYMAAIRRLQAAQAASVRRPASENALLGVRSLPAAVVNAEYED